jgi:hypothetical protein
MVFISLLSLFWEGIKPSSWIHIAKPSYQDIKHILCLAYWAIIVIWKTLKRYQDINKLHQIGVMTVMLLQEENVLIVAAPITVNNL